MRPARAITTPSSSAPVPAGAVALKEAGMRVAVLESELVGGECSFWACIPSKTLPRPLEVVGAVDHVAGVSTPAKQWSHWTREEGIAVRAGIQFPTFSEALLTAADRLAI